MDKKTCDGEKWIKTKIGWKREQVPCYDTMQEAIDDVNVDIKFVIRSSDLKMVNADAYYGEYLKAEDVKQDVSVTIESVSLDTIDGDKKLVVTLVGFMKKFVLNKTNKDRLKQIYKTAETDEWKNKTFTLGTETVQYKGDQVPALRVKLIPESKEEGA